MGLKEKIRNIIAAGAIAASTMAGAQELDLGYNALEVGRTDQETTRIRAVTNAEYGLLGWNGMNQVDDGAYFGRNVFTLGDGKTRFALVDKRTGDGSIDTKVGLRNTGLPEKLGGYGSLDAAFDGDAANLTLFYGRPLGKGFGVEIYQDTELPFAGPVGHWTEVQLNRSLGEHFGAYARAEMADFSDPSYIVGIALK